MRLVDIASWYISSQISQLLVGEGVSRWSGECVKVQETWQETQALDIHTLCASGPQVSQPALIGDESSICRFKNIQVLFSLSLQKKSFFKGAISSLPLITPKSILYCCLSFGWGRIYHLGALEDQVIPLSFGFITSNKAKIILRSSQRYCKV